MPYYEQVPLIQSAAPGHGNLIPVTGHYIVEHLSVLTSQSIPVFQGLRNSEGALKAEPVDPRTALSLPEPEKGRKVFLVDRQWTAKLFARTDTFDAQLAPLVAEQPETRAQAVAEIRTALATLKGQKVDPGVKAKTIMDSVSQAFLLNKASLKIKPQEVTVHEKALSKDSESIVGLALEMVEDSSVMSGLFSCFEGLSNGQTVNHVLRVFASFTGFVSYYHTLHQNRLSAQLRGAFSQLYRPSYQKLLPHLPENLMTSDHVLQLPPLGFFERKEYALGAFLHDIGKMGNIDYFESDAAYDPVQIQQHVFLGAGLILMNYGNVHNSARLMTGDHHNALGKPSGYGVTRIERERSARKPVDSIRVLSGTSDGFVSGEALGWLPAEMLAVVDVYDAMTDNSRVYKKAMSTVDAVCFLEDIMVADGKLDPVLVDLYIDFLRTLHVPVPEGRGFQAKYQGL